MTKSLAAAAIAFALLCGLWLMGDRRLEDAASAYREQRSLQQWLKARAPEGDAPQAASLADLAGQTAKAHSLVLGGVKESGGGVEVKLSRAPFNSLMAWIDALERRPGVTVLSFTAKKTDAPGRVDATLSIAQKP